MTEPRLLYLLEGFIFGPTMCNSAVACALLWALATEVHGLLGRVRGPGAVDTDGTAAAVGAAAAGSLRHDIAALGEDVLGTLRCAAWVGVPAQEPALCDTDRVCACAARGTVACPAGADSRCSATWRAWLRRC